MREREITDRDLAESLSEILGQVEDDREILKITVGDRHVADLVPAGARESEMRMSQLVAEGKVTPARRPLPLPDVVPHATGKSASAIILAEREEEDERFSSSSSN